MDSISTKSFGTLPVKRVLLEDENSCTIICHDGLRLMFRHNPVFVSDNRLVVKWWNGQAWGTVMDVPCDYWQDLNQEERDEVRNNLIEVAILIVGGDIDDEGV